MVLVVTTSGLCKGVGKLSKYWEAWVGDQDWDMDVWYFRGGRSVARSIVCENSDLASVWRS